MECKILDSTLSAMATIRHDGDIVSIVQVKTVNWKPEMTQMHPSVLGLKERALLLKWVQDGQSILQVVLGRAALIANPSKGSGLACRMQQAQVKQIISSAIKSLYIVMQ